MPRLRKGSLPTYRLYKRTGQAVVTLDGHDHYLGPFGTPSSKQKYAAIIRAWQQRQGQSVPAPATPLVPNDQPTINELILAYLKYARDHYRPNHGENKEAGCVNDALTVLQEQGYGREPADAFRPRDLKKVREAMVAKDWSRSYINSQVNRIKRMFAHAVEDDLLPGSVYHALLVVKGLRRGTPGVRETKRVQPVPVAHIKAVLAKAHAVLKSMLLFAYYTGARPGEICALKFCQIDRSRKVWVYAVPPEANKTDHHGQDRHVYIGPRAQRILNRWIQDLAPDEHVFNPARAEALRQADRRAKRKSPLWPSHLRRLAAKRKANPTRTKRTAYDPASFRRAVKRLCTAASVPVWSPNRLRHNAATRFRKRYGLEVARILLGHRKMNTTEIYAEADIGKAQQAARRLG